MTSTMPEPPAAPPGTDVDADARFAAYLADIAAHVDDPTCGEECRSILNDDPQTRRALFDLVEAVSLRPAPPPRLVLWTAVAMLVLAAALAIVIAGYVS